MIVVGIQNMLVGVAADVLFLLLPFLAFLPILVLLIHFVISRAAADLVHLILKGSLRFKNRFAFLFLRLRLFLLG